MLNSMKAHDVLYQVEVYADKDGNEPVKEYVLELFQKNDKDSRIKAKKTP